MGGLDILMNAAEASNSSEPDILNEVVNIIDVRLPTVISKVITHIGEKIKESELEYDGYWADLYKVCRRWDPSYSSLSRCYSSLLLLEDLYCQTDGELFGAKVPDYLVDLSKMLLSAEGIGAVRRCILQHTILKDTVYKDDLHLNLLFRECRGRVQNDCSNEQAYEYTCMVFDRFYRPNAITSDWKRRRYILRLALRGHSYDANKMLSEYKVDGDHSSTRSLTQWHDEVVDIILEEDFLHKVICFETYVDKNLHL